MATPMFEPQALLRLLTGMAGRLSIDPPDEDAGWDDPDDDAEHDEEEEEDDGDDDADRLWLRATCCARASRLRAGRLVA